MSRMKDVLNHFESEASEFDSIITKLIPDYNQMCTILLEFIPYTPEDTFSFIDLGTGTGTLAKRIKDKFPNSSATCVDISSNMLAIAEQKLGSTAEFIQSDFYSFAFDKSYDLIVSSLALHHIESTEEKSDFYKKIFNALSPTGTFLNIDVLLGANDFIQQKYLNNWKNFMLKSTSKQEVEETWLKNYHSEDRPASLFDHFILLNDAGFTEIDCLYKSYNYGVYMAAK
ncbi:class I SAM-dependent methyltransferase [Candidatus Enterococcus ferrettii]|uniref:tRNA (Cmo5U34)-methyltransferase n=1 Tax=Candidatus Enterococcus ferrettii TaxID=2815324 RepID=A0ABV0ETA8_9ENTE|nr:class I SAM-dependent methyltransferase [Enterococcus sp. 665A]MBO1340236.1 methyltransferase domain-containing protein [Enterococcus sp. 665A]